MKTTGISIGILVIKRSPPKTAYSYCYAFFSHLRRVELNPNPNPEKVMRRCHISACMCDAAMSLKFAQVCTRHLGVSLVGKVSLDSIYVVDDSSMLFPGNRYIRNCLSVVNVPSSIAVAESKTLDSVRIRRDHYAVYKLEDRICRCSRKTWIAHRHSYIPKIHRTYPLSQANEKERRTDAAADQ